MEKILKFEKSKFGEESSLYRFQCDCLEPEDAMDVNVESSGKEKFITITMYANRHGIINRIKDAYKVLKGNWCWGEFVVRSEDHKNLSDIFNPDKKYSELP